MMRMTPHLPRLVLTGACLALAAVFAVEVLPALPEDGVSNSPNPDSLVTQIANLSPPDIDANIAGILDRPLFASSRSAADKTQEEEPQTEEKAPAQIQHRLSGVVIRPSGSEALFQQEGGKPVSVMLGGQIDGFTLASIDSDHVVIKSSSGEQIVQLSGGSSGKRPAPRPRKPNPVRPPAAKPAPPSRPAPPSAALKGRQASK
jgi:hypothetical protein